MQETREVTESFSEWIYSVAKQNPGLVSQREIWELDKLTLAKLMISRFLEIKAESTDDFKRFVLKVVKLEGDVGLRDAGIEKLKKDLEEACQKSDRLQTELREMTEEMVEMVACFQEHHNNQRLHYAHLMEEHIHFEGDKHNSRHQLIDRQADRVPDDLHEAATHLQPPSNSQTNRSAGELHLKHQVTIMDRFEHDESKAVKTSQNGVASEMSGRNNSRVGVAETQRKCHKNSDERQGQASGCHTEHKKMVNKVTQYPKQVSGKDVAGMTETLEKKDKRTSDKVRGLVAIQQTETDSCIQSVEEIRMAEDQTTAIEKQLRDMVLKQQRLINELETKNKVSLLSIQRLEAAILGRDEGVVLAVRSKYGYEETERSHADDSALPSSFPSSQPL